MSPKLNNHYARKSKMSIFHSEYRVSKENKIIKKTYKLVKNKDLK